MFAIHDQRFRDILLLALGFLGALWFFFDLANHHPLSSVDIQLTEEGATQKADSMFLSWEFQPLELKKRARVVTYSDMIDQLQEEYGRKEFLRSMRNSTESALPLYSWSVDEFEVKENERQQAFRFSLSERGELIDFKASDELIKEQTPFNRKAIRYAAGRIRDLSKEIEDSVITELVNYQHLRTEASAFFRMTLGSGVDNHNNYIWRGIDYYVNQSYWNRFSFSKDSLRFNDDGSVRYATAYLTSIDTVMGIVPKLEIELLPAGVVRSFSVDMGNGIVKDEARSNLKRNLVLGIVLSFIVWVLISFYLRIKARALDTRPALVVAIISGFLIPVLMVLEFSRNFGLNFETFELSTLFSQILGFGVFGAITATAFFVATAVSDSVTRQYWPEKLKTWDLVRRGMFKNKPIGWAIIRAISIGSIIAGLFSILINFFPTIYISGGAWFLEGMFVLAPVANIIMTLLIGVGFVVVSFLIIGNQFYAVTAKKWGIPIISGFLFALFDPLLIVMQPVLLEALFNFMLGLTIGFFYIRYDFVTVALGFFIFLNFLSTSNGWLVSNSPDESIFFGFIVTMILLSGVGLFFLLKGDDTDSLPEYVPDYIEDLAKEQRVKQELDIARTVQKTFLPNRTPEIPGFDTAAMCEPAQETGGDYYDIISLDDERAAVAIGDVSGKGIQAAFYMTFAKGVIHSLCTIFPSPKTMLYRVNKLFNENATRGTFISMIYGVLDSKKSTFTYLRAGHNPLLYKKANGEMEWQQPRGVAIGMCKGEAFNQVMEEYTVELSKGDVLVLYTDGITEAQNEKEEFYDEKRLYKLIKREKTTSAKELRDLIIEDVRTFVGDALQYDDMTLVVIKA